MSQDIQLTQVQKDYLDGLGIKPDSVSASVLSDIKALNSCYNWYLEKQHVSHENAYISARTWMQKYALHDNNGICLENTPEDMWDRLAKVLAEVEVATNRVHKEYSHWFAYFRKGLENFSYSPQGSGLFALGNTFVKACGSNCFVLPPPNDSLESIFDTAKRMSKIYAARGGVGFDISKLRPKNSKTNNASKTSTGSTSFMDFYSHVTGLIGQSGRRGALLLSIKVSHPDILNFIEEKQDNNLKPFFSELASKGIDINDFSLSSIADRLKSTSHANVSVLLDDAFMLAVKNDTNYELFFDFENSQYPRISRIVKAKEIWNKLMEAAHKSAEPGILNYGPITRESPADQYKDIKIKYTDPVTKKTSNISYSFETVGLNPCAEETLSEYDSCNLGIFNLPMFVKKAYTKEAFFDFDAYKQIIYLGIRAQDNIKTWDIPMLPLEENRIPAVLGRRISVGNTGVSDAVAMLGIRYDSEEAIEFIEKLYSFLANNAYQASTLLAVEKGSFPVFDWNKHKLCPFIQRLSTETRDLIEKNGLRNIGLLTQSPAGSMSILFRNCSSGIEPMFKSEYIRNVKNPGTNDFVQSVIYHQAIQDALNSGMSKEEAFNLFVPADKVHYKKRIALQSKAQLSIDHSISSTINLPETTTVEEVSDIYMEAYDMNLKGVTVYVNGCRTGVLVDNKEAKKINNEISHAIIERPKTTQIDIHKVKYKEKPWCVLVGKTNNIPCEVFAGIEEDTPLPNKYYKAELTKRSRGQYALTVELSEDADSDVIKIGNIGARFPLPEGMVLTRFISLSLRNRVPVSEICEQLTKSSNSMFDYPAVLNRVLKNYIPEEELIEKEKAKGEVCPECRGELLIKRESGCISKQCTSCSYVNSKCN